jgi:xylulokinase
MKYILAHDLGTSGNKATLFTLEGKLFTSRIFTYNTHYFNSNWAEQNPDDWWKAVCSTSKDILKDINSKDVVAVSFSGQMMGCLLVDKSGVPLRDAIIWADQRATDEANEIGKKFSKEEFYRIAGHRNSPSYSLQKLLWVKKNQSDIYKKAYKLLNSKDYIVFKLTGNYYTDFSDATGTCMMDVEKLHWSEKIIEATGIREEILPDPKPSTYIAGEVTRHAADETGLKIGTPVVCGGGDGVCAAVGSGCVQNGEVYSYIGSSAWIALTAEKPIIDKKMRTDNWAHALPGHIMPCGTMQTAGGSYNWMKNELCKFEVEESKKRDSTPYDLIENMIENSPAGANGLLFLPYLLGERSPRWNPNARGAFIGIKMEHKREDLIRAVVEGVILNLNLILDVFKKKKVIKEMTVIGGGAKSQSWTQIMADIYNLKIKIPDYLEEATSMGAAVIGGVGIGVYKDFNSINKFINFNNYRKPIDKNKREYDKLKPIFNESYSSLVKIYDKLSSF